jgi:hypothetical protein
MMEYDIVGIHDVSGAKHDLIDCPEGDEIDDVPLLTTGVMDFATSQRKVQRDYRWSPEPSSPTVEGLLPDDILYYRHNKQDHKVVIVRKDI